MSASALPPSPPPAPAPAAEEAAQLAVGAPVHPMSSADLPLPGHLDRGGARGAPKHAYTTLCAHLSKLSLMLAVVGLIAIVLCVQLQVVSRYVFNDTATWTEPLALQLVLYVTALGVAVGVRDAGHIGLESFASLLPEAWRLRVELVVHALVGAFGAVMTWQGWLWTSLKWSDTKPMLGVPVGLDYLALLVAGALIVLFSIEHLIALVRGEDVIPSWN